jgi:hypothetical protein
LPSASQSLYQTGRLIKTTAVRLETFEPLHFEHGEISAGFFTDTRFILPCTIAGWFELDG